MPQTDAWEREYRNPKLVTKKAEPQNDVKRFLKWLKKEQGVALEHLHVLDLGCGTGRNANYLAELGCIVTGFEISSTALRIAQERATELGVSPSYHLRSIGAPYQLSDDSIDLALDVTSSNSLNEHERSVYLTETARVLKTGGYIFVRALCKEGDANVKELLKRNPGSEYDTYVNTQMGLTERVFSREDFVATYSPLFSIEHLEKKSGYAHFNGRIYKRNYWLAYLKKI